MNGYIGALQVDFHWPTHRLIVETDGAQRTDTRSRSTATATATWRSA